MFNLTWTEICRDRRWVTNVDIQVAYCPAILQGIRSLNRHYLYPAILLLKVYRQKKKKKYKHAHLKIFKNSGQMRTLVYMRVCKAIVKTDRACVRRFVITDVCDSN